MFIKKIARQLPVASLIVLTLMIFLKTEFSIFIGITNIKYPETCSDLV